MSKLNFAFLCILLASCATSEFSDNSAIRTTEEDTPTVGPLEMPAGAGGELARIQPVLYLDIDCEDQTNDPELQFNMSAVQQGRLQVEAMIPRLKRFTVYSVFNGAAKRLYEEMADLGQVAPRSTTNEQLPEADAFLNVKLSYACEKRGMSGRTDDPWFTLDGSREYVATLTYTITDAAGKVLDDTPEASGVVTHRITKDIGRRFNPNTGKDEYRDAFNPKDESSQKKVLGELNRTLNQFLAARLGAAIPLTTPVTGLNRGADMFSIGKGQSHGVFRETQVAIWARDGDFTYVIADAVAEPTTTTASLRVTRWNTRDADANAIVQDLQRNPKNLVNYKLFATTKDIPLKEQLRLRD